MQQRWKKIDYTTPSGAQGGPGIQAQIPWYSNTPYIDMTAAQFQGISADIGASIGDVWWLGGKAPASGGNAFMFVRARAALALGQLVSFEAPTAGTLTIPGVPVSTAAAITTNISTVAAGVNGFVDGYIFVNPVAGAATPQLRRIKANNAAAAGNFTVALQDFLRPNSPLDQDVFDTFATFANADPLCVFRPYNVIVNTAATVPVGVALGTVTSGNYTIIQVAGLALVQSVGNVAHKGIAAGVPAIGDAAGVIEGQLDNAATEYIKYFYGANVTPLIAQAAAGPIVIPCYVNFLGN